MFCRLFQPDENEEKTPAIADHAEEQIKTVAKKKPSIPESKDKVDESTESKDKEKTHRNTPQTDKPHSEWEDFFVLQ